MSSSNTTLSHAVDYIRQNQRTFITSWSIFLFGFGSVGHSLSFYVLTRRQFLSNPCTYYFLALTVSGSVVTFGTVPLRLLQMGYSIDVFNIFEAVCRALSFIFGAVRVLSSWFVLLASIDRFLCSSSSSTLRGWSSIRIAPRAIVAVTLLISAVYSHMLIYHTIYLPQRTCTYAPGVYQTLLSICNMIFWSWLPSAGMLIFGLLTVRNVRGGSRRVLPVVIQRLNGSNRRKKDMQLIRMVLVHSLFFGSTTTIQASVALAVALGVKPSDDALKKAQDSYLINIFSYIALTGSCLTFYLFVLSSQLFRRELLKLFQRRRQIPNGPVTPSVY